MGNTATTSTPVDPKIRNEYINVRDMANVLLSFQTIFVFVPLLGMTWIPVGGVYIALISSFLGLWLTWELRKTSRSYLVLFSMSVPNQAFVLSALIALICFVISVFQIIYQQRRFYPCYKYHIVGGYASGRFTQYQNIGNPPAGVVTSSWGYTYCELAPWTTSFAIGIGVVTILNIIQYVFFCMVVHRLLKVAYQTRTGRLSPAEIISAGQGSAANLVAPRPDNVPVNQPIVVVANPSAPPFGQSVPYNMPNQYIDSSSSSSSAAPSGYSSNYPQYPEKVRPPMP